eukprot:TRINITY_DN26421_c0_g1_i1.p1 TRINITY_DN26421_c0_g1~~TRINITY_DN26421_c0_g1_i1.p1  ORF type:complete len:358 (-),score=30.06 TRINITY_DN26421_c0_g1_i1:153-1226(-)
MGLSCAMGKRDAILYIGPSVSWKGYLAAIHSEGLVAVACIAEDFGGGPICAFFPFSDLRAPAGPQSLGFEALIEHREPYRILEQAKALEEQRMLRFIGVLRASEADTAVIDFVAAGLGVAHNPLSTVLARRDKAAMKEALRAAGLEHAAFARVADTTQVADVVDRLGLPVVVKTPSCASSSDVFVCTTKEAARDRVGDILGRTNSWGDIPSYVLLEEYLDGPEYAVNVFADGRDRAVVTDIWAYEKQETEHGHILYCAVRSMDPASQPDACSYALAVCKAVGIVLEAGHVELKLTKKGPVMVEVGARRPGGQKTELLQKMVPSWDPYSAQVRAACGRSVAVPPSFAPVAHYLKRWHS